MRSMKDNIRSLAKARKSKGPGNSAKFDKVMHEWGQGGLHSGSKKGPVVKSQRQALAIAFHSARKARSSGGRS